MPRGVWQLLALLACFTCVTCQTENARAQAYLTEYSANRSELLTRYVTVNWAYNTNLTSHNSQVLTNHSLELSEFNKNQATKAKDFDLAQVNNSSLKRQLEKILDVGISGYENEETLRKISELGAEMRSTYSSAKWCKTEDDCKSLDPDLSAIFTTSRDYDELKDAWKGWRDVSGAKVKQQYEEYVQLVNMAIKAEDKYDDIGGYWRSWYEQDTFETDVQQLFVQLAPLYDQLQAYVRRKLREHYSEHQFPESGHIPAHLLGNMWAQTWNNIYDLTEPYPGQGRDSLTDVMKEKGYTITQMYELSEAFFVSLGLPPMPDSFWTESMLEKPDDGRNVVCHASAWDFYNGTDFRIKQCTEVTEEQLITVHHEMGHVEYFLEYRHLPVLFRGGANPGFHEGMADIVTLSFQTPEHLKKIGLLDELPAGNEGDINFLFQMALTKVAFLPFDYLIDQWRWSVFREGDINFLFQMALTKVAFLPFGYLIDQWRWSVFRGETTPNGYNTEWWKLRCQYQGIAPPVERSEDDFDPAAKYHIPANTPYIRYFVAFVAQFQWHKALCELIGQKDNLHRCDIYDNTVAGDRLKEMLQLGSSKPWGEAMLAITKGTEGETDKLDAGALLGYFKPLQDWLTADNEAHNENVGWTKDRCPPGSLRGDALSGAPPVGGSLASLLLMTLIGTWLAAVVRV